MPKMSDHEQWLKAYMIENGALVQLLDEGEFTDPQDSKFGKLGFNILVGLPDQSVKTWSMNKTTRSKLAAVWGDDSVAWVSRWVRVKIAEQNVRGEMRDVLFGYPADNPQAQPTLQSQTA